MGPFHHPTSWLFAFLLVLFLLASGTDMRDIAKIKDDFFDKAVIIPLIQTQVLQSIFPGRLYHYCPKRINQNGAVWGIGTRN